MSTSQILNTVLDHVRVVELVRASEKDPPQMKVQVQIEGAWFDVQRVAMMPDHFNESVNEPGDELVFMQMIGEDDGQN